MLKAETKVKTLVTEPSGKKQKIMSETERESSLHRLLPGMGAVTVNITPDSTAAHILPPYTNFIQLSMRAGGCGLPKG